MPKSKPKRVSPAALRPRSKQELLVGLLQRKEGATIAEVVKVTGWQPHSLRGAISGTFKKKLGLAVISDKVAGRGRVYRVVPSADCPTRGGRLTIHDTDIRMCTVPASLGQPLLRWTKKVIQWVVQRVE